MFCLVSFVHLLVINIKHLLDETESNIQFIASRQGNIGRSEAEPNYFVWAQSTGCWTRSSPISVLFIPKKSVRIN